MVNYVFTPWRDRHELLLVRRQLYAPFDDLTSANTNSSSSTKQLDQKVADGALPHTGLDEGETMLRDQHQAVARVSIWMQRGNCPHMVESTALLMSAMLNDQDAAMKENAASSAYAIRAAYSAAFSRFVTGLLDGHQDKQRKQSMYSIAKTIGLPATFVELRHQSTHEQLPSLAKLRSAAKKALLWIWDYYWKHLKIDNADSCRAVILKYLREDGEARDQKIIKDLEQWPMERVLETIADVRKTLPGNKVFLKCEELSRILKEEVDVEEEEEKTMKDMTMANTDTQIEDSELAEEDFGWSRFEGTWKPKPIGIA